jgi:23S rRNA (cytosine1962-C5)-methyltransferase
MPRRYQLRKEAVGIVRGGHPWIFRDHLSSAASVFADGDWLRLHAGDNTIVGHGIYEATGAIAIRVLRRGPDRPDAAWLRARLAAAIERRRELAQSTDGLRLVHGESDGIPAIVADRFGDAIVVASYSAGADGLAHYVARLLASEAFGSITSVRGAWRSSSPNIVGSSPTASVGDASAPGPRHTGSSDPSAPHAAEPSANHSLRSIIGPARNVVLRPGRRRASASEPTRVIRGGAVELAHFVEDGIGYTVDLAGHKTGAYLDLRGLRRAIAAMPLAGARVLNLFAYTGMLGLAAERAGAAEITSVDVSAAALALAQTHHVGDATRHRFVTADVFDWLPALETGEFDLVIVDPPAMTSRKMQVPAVLAAYTKLYRAAAPRVKPGGAVVAACCTSRIERGAFRTTVRDALGAGFALERELAPEPDHPVGFPQADYLKIAIWRGLAQP